MLYLLLYYFWDCSIWKFIFLIGFFVCLFLVGWFFLLCLLLGFSIKSSLNREITWFPLSISFTTLACSCLFAFLNSWQHHIPLQAAQVKDEPPLVQLFSETQQQGTHLESRKEGWLISSGWREFKPHWFFVFVNSNYTTKRAAVYHSQMTHSQFGS